MPYEPPSPQPPPRQPPPKDLKDQKERHTASSQNSLAQWLTRPAQGGAPASSNAPPLPNWHNRAPPASASAASTYVPERTTSIPPPPRNGQTNGHSHIKQQPRPQIPPQIPQARAAQTSLIPPIPQPQPQPQPAQPRPQHSSIPPSFISPRYSNGSGSGNGVRPVAPSFSAMDVDELANDYEDDDPVPLVVSDLDPRFGQAPTVKSPSAASKPPGTPSALRQPVVSPHNDRPTHFSPSQSKTNAHSLHPTTPSKPATVSVSIPSFSPSLSTKFSPESSKKNLSDLPTVRPPMPQTKTKPADTVDRRTKTVVNHVSPGEPLASSATTTASASTAPAPSAIVAAVERQIKGGRPKGWKPGMSYREVALRNLGIDTNDPTLPAEILLPLRDRRVGKIGRPRLDKPTSEIKKRIGRPPKTKEPKLRKPHKSTQVGRPMYGKRIGRPPLKTVEEVQRAIFQGSAVQFAAFKCEWAGCRAELQNLATLRRHVEFVHGRGGFVKTKKKQALKTAPPLTCRWRKCALREPPLVFASLQDFVKHTEYYHLEPLSWHQGDGVANSSHIGPPAAPTSIRLADKEAELHRLRQTGQLDFDDKDAKDGQKSCATTAAPDMAIRVPVKYVPGYLKDGGQQVTPVLRDTFLEMSAAFWTAEEWGRRIKEAYRQQNKRPERGWTG